MIKVRFGTFETNSSSMHSVVIVDNVGGEDKDYTKGLCIKNKKLYIKNSEQIEFGRYPFEILSTFRDKLMYAIAALSKEEIIESVGKLMGIDDIVYPIVHWWNGKDEVFTGEIDHQSQGVLERFLTENKINIKDFLTQKRYMVIVDGDEYCIFDNFVDCGLVTDKIKRGGMIW